VKSGYTLITGIGRRAGFHLARSFLERGRPVIGTFRTDYARLHKLESLGAELHRCDFNNRDDVERLIDAVKSGHRDLRGIIHNASQWLAEGGRYPGQHRHRHHDARPCRDSLRAESGAVSAAAGTTKARTPTSSISATT
jgi:nucleoside-diphosphate-sugar epimerase